MKKILWGSAGCGEKFRSLNVGNLGVETKLIFYKDFGHGITRPKGKGEKAQK